MVIKGITLESGQQPVICIPVMGKDSEEVLAEAQRVIEHGARMIEWRIDYLEDMRSPGLVEEILRELQQICKQAILLVTVRTRKQGGLARIAEPELSELYRRIAGTHSADLLDVEFFEVDRPQKLIRELKKEGVGIITSHHDFEDTPRTDVMTMLFHKMAEGGSDLVKLAVMPQSLSDVLDLLQVTCTFREEYPEIPVASMSMGGMGIISRLCGEAFGSCMTFGTMGKSSAPGQMDEEDLRTVLDVIHRNFER